MTTEVIYNLFTCRSCDAIDCLKTFPHEPFNPLMNCYSCKNKDTMEYNRQISENEHGNLFRGENNILEASN